MDIKLAAVIVAALRDSNSLYDASHVIENYLI